MMYCRPLTKAEEHCLVHYARRHLTARDRLIVTGILFAGLQLEELRRLRRRDVYAGAVIARTIPLPSSSPRRGGRMDFPVTPELERALAAYRSSQNVATNPDAPLFIRGDVQRESDEVPLSRKGMTRIVTRALDGCGIRSDPQLGPTSLRKRFARKIWAASNNDMLVTRDALRVWSAIEALNLLDLERRTVEHAMRVRNRIAA